MSQTGNHKKTAKASKRFKSPRFCVDSLPTDCSFLTPNMSATNISCQSCMCCADEDEDPQTPCCQSLKCEVNQRRITENKQTQTRKCPASDQNKPAEKCCQITPPLDPSCPVCKEEYLAKLAEPPCEECKIAKKNTEHSCPACKSTQANDAESTASCPACKSTQVNKEKAKAEHSCPACKSKQKPQKMKEKELRCPSCSQPIQTPCCDGSSHAVNIILIPEKLLKEMSGKDDEDSDEEGKPCCRMAKEEKKESCCKMAEEEEIEPCCKMAKEKKKEPCCKMAEEEEENEPCCDVEPCKSKKAEPKKVKEPVPCCGHAPCCNLESCKSNKQPGESKPEEKTEKTGKNKEKNENIEKKTCGETCKAMKEDAACCCVFPPAYKQYSCIGRISGNCDCGQTADATDNKDE